MFKLFSRVLLVVVATLGWSSATLAAYVEYSDQNLWDNDVGQLSMATWDNYIIPPGGFFGGSNGIDGVDGEMTFTNPGSGNAPFIFDNDFIGGAGTPIGLGSGNVIATSQGINVDWTGQVNGVGFDLRGYGPGVGSTTFNIILDSNGQVFTKSVTNPVGGFWGVVNTTGTISSVSVSVASGGVVTVMDNFTLARVPAPGGLILLVGLVCLTLTRRLR